MPFSTNPSDNVPIRSMKPDFLDLFRAYPVFDRLCTNLSIRDIISLTRTCKPLSHLYRTLIRLQHWNVDRDLLRFVEDPRRFRSQLGKCNALISGSFALQFFERVAWEGSDLDLFVEAGEDAQVLANHLVQVERYRYIRQSFLENYKWESYAEVGFLLPVRGEALPAVG